MKSGVYIITCVIGIKHYIGVSVNVKYRLCKHRSDLRGNRHRNAHLQSAFNLYGEQNFTFESLEYYPEDQMASFEHWWCIMLNTHDRDFGYNIRPTDPTVFAKISNETKKKLSIIKTGTISPNKGKKLSHSVVENNRLSHLKYIYTIHSPVGEVIEDSNINDFAIKNKLHPGALLNTLRGYDNNGRASSQHKGYRIISKKSISKAA